MNEEHWATVILGVVLLTILGILAVVIKSGLTDWGIR